MGVSASYFAYTPDALEVHLKPVSDGEVVIVPDHEFAYENMNDWFYPIHTIFTGGLTKITPDNLISNAVAGQYYSLEKEAVFDWWNIQSDAYNTAERVQQIYTAFAGIDIESTVRNSNVELHEKYHETYIYHASELRKLYKSAYENNLAVIVDFW